MDKLVELIREYRILLGKEKEIEAKKAQIRSLVLQAMESRKVKFFHSEHGIAKINVRFKLIPKRAEVLRLLSVEDIFLFAQFTSTKVKEWLVPKYGREKLLPLFLAEKNSYIQILSKERGKDGLLPLEGVIRVKSGQQH